MSLLIFPKDGKSLFSPKIEISLLVVTGHWSSVWAQSIREYKYLLQKSYVNKSKTSKTKM